MPDLLRLIVTSRQEMEVIDYFANLHPFILNADSPQNLQDIRSFLRDELDALKLSASDRVINEVIEKSENVPLRLSRTR